MNDLLKRLASALAAVFVLMVCAGGSLAQHKDWKPVSPAELQMAAPKVEADADAEALLWDVYVTDEDSGGDLQTVLHHYVRIKIFNERGREAFSKIEIPFGRVEGVGYDVKIKDIAARTTKPDGTVVELKGSEIFDRDVVKGSGLKLKAKSFAVPGIEPGAVIEYRWKEIRGTVSFYQRLQFAREIPVHLVQYHIKPISHPEFGMNGQGFNFRVSNFTKEKNGFQMTSLANVPSYKEEPQMPPEFAVRPWMLLYYTREQKIEPEKFWKDYGRKEFENHKDAVKVSNEVKQAAAEAVGSETDPEQKIRKIFNYVRANIKNIYDDQFQMTADQLKNVKENKTPSDTLKRKQGSTDDINHLFAAMATAAGFDARIANLARRSDIVFQKWFTDDYFMRTENIAVKIGNAWRFFDPGTRYATFGMLRWEEEGQPVLISDGKEPEWTTTPLSPPASSVEKRSGKFKLLEDGTLEGTVRLEYTGHLAAYHKEYNDDDTPQQREDGLRNMIKRYILGSAEVTDLSIENFNDPDKPFVYTFTIKVPGYATRTGKRIFMQPNVFERSARPMFESSTRQHSIHFEYPYSELDDIAIELPVGYELENPDAPGVVQDRSGIAVNNIQISVTNDKRMIVYKRNFSFGNGDVITFGKEVYPGVKGLFEAVYKANTHALTLRQVATTAATKP